MKTRSLLLGLITGISLIYVCPVNAHNDGILNRIKQGQIDEIRFRIRTTTYPLNDKATKDSAPEGFCVDLAKKLEKELNIDYPDKKIIVNFNNYTYDRVDSPIRFQTIRDKKADIQCGSDSRILSEKNYI